MVKILSIFVAFFENMDFTKIMTNLFHKCADTITA